MKKLIILIIIIGIGVALAGFWYWQKNPFSKEILKLEIIGPGEAEVFEEIEYTVKYKNNGEVRLEQARLVFEFPENTLLEEGKSRRQEIGPEELGDIYPGEEKTFQFKGRLFGKQGEIKEAKAFIYYKPRDLNASYESDAALNTLIKNVPLSFDFDLPSKIEKGREFKFYINYFSSLDYLVDNLGVKAEYPGGFEFIKCSPESLADNEWDLPLLNKAEGGRIAIEGRLSGELKEKKLFKAILGLWKDDEFIPLKEITKGVEIARPQLFIFQKVNGSDNYVANPGDSLHYEIFFRNISDEPFTDLFMAITLESNVFDFNTIKADLGKFKQGDNSIVWDWRDVSKLRYLDKGEEGKIDFWIDLKNDNIDGPQVQNTVLKNSVLVSSVKEEFEIKLNSKLAVYQKAYYQEDIFGNSGPIPPKIGETTAYTIIWEAKNYHNDVKNVRVKAVLPENVELTGRIFPESEASKFTFDRASREIIWTIGDMEAGKGVKDSAPNIAFQVRLVPSASQRGRKALLINEARIIGEDQWTDKETESFDFSIDTGLPDDDSVSEEEGIVR